MSSQLTEPSTRVPVGPATRARRARTITLETQSAYKFGLAVVIGAATIWSSMPIVLAAVLMTISVVIAARSLTLLAAEPSDRISLRVRSFAFWDGALAATLALVSVVSAAALASSAAVIAGAAAIALAAMRLRTRYSA